jgi:hypothetical protein
MRPTERRGARLLHKNVLQLAQMGDPRGENRGFPKKVFDGSLEAG